jgi:hypothetical protein
MDAAAAGTRRSASNPLQNVVRSKGFVWVSMCLLPLCAALPASSSRDFFLFIFNRRCRMWFAARASCG